MPWLFVTWLFVTWGFLIFVICLFIAASNGYRNLWLHLHWPPHRQRMKRAQLCLELGKHYRQTPGWGERCFEFAAYQAYRLCDECGCPPDLWPAGVLAIHVGVR